MKDYNNVPEVIKLNANMPLSSSKTIVNEDSIRCIINKNYMTAIEHVEYGKIIRSCN